MRFLVVVRAFVACCGDEQHVRGLGVLDGHAERWARAAAAPRIAQDLGAMRHGIVDGLDSVRSPPRSSRRQELQRHKTDTAPRHASHANAVVADAGDGARAVRAMHLVVPRVAVIVGEIGPVDIVDIAISIVIDAIPGNLVGVHPHLLAQVGVLVIDASVDYPNDNASTHLSCEHLPRLGSIDVIAAPRVHAPQLVQRWVIRQMLQRALHLDDFELLPQRRLDSVRQDVTRWLGSDIRFEEGLQRNCRVVVVYHGELLPIVNCSPVGHQPTGVVRRQVRAKGRLERDCAVVIVDHFKPGPTVEVAGLRHRNMAVASGDVSVVRCANRHNRQIVVQGAATQHGAVLSRAARPCQQAPSCTRGVRRTLRPVARVRRAHALALALGHGRARRQVVQGHPRVRHRELDGVVLLELVEQVLLCDLRQATQDCHTQAG
mmetsp:Transcript_23993/g.72067  ORF Transcript_23993/g.72067 Transcript_23993/m.72067 type:complete len:432 (+) Transcript_23993:1856-3151(+)